MTPSRIAGLFYVLTIVAGSMALFFRGPLGTAANAVAMLAYVAVTLLLYRVFVPVHEPLSRVAAGVGLAGCAASALSMSGVVLPVNPLAIFGGYCLLIGLLMVRSTFAPRAIGVLMMIGGLSWLTFAWPPLARSLMPYNFAPGIFGESVLTIWLLASTSRQAPSPTATPAASHGARS
jgi:Domain of unknown function (DUF4386)